MFRESWIWIYLRSAWYNKATLSGYSFLVIFLVLVIILWNQLDFIVFLGAFLCAFLSYMLLLATRGGLITYRAYFQTMKRIRKTHGRGSFVYFDRSYDYCSQIGQGIAMDDAFQMGMLRRIPYPSVE
jgi:hypothetical protein